MMFVLFSIVSTSLYAQTGNVGINTVNPQTVLHIDGRKDNPSNGTPDSIQARNDVAVTESGFVGIGNIQPRTPLHIYSNGLSLGHPRGGLLVEGDNIGSRIGMLHYSNITPSSGFNSLQGYSAKGTKENPMPLLANDEILSIVGFGYNGNEFKVGGQAAMTFYGSDDFKVGSQPTHIAFATTPLNGSSRLERLRISSEGKVGIGTSNPTQALHVIGNILASGTITPDYVFEKYFDGESMLNKNYKMMTLEEVENFTKINKHLPGVPSAREVEENGGILLNRAAEINLEKIEELFLHAIELKNDIKKQELENEKLKNQILKQENEINEMKQMIKQLINSNK